MPEAACTECRGNGSISVSVYNDDTLHYEVKYITCPTCGGSGTITYDEDKERGRPKKN